MGTARKATIDEVIQAMKDGYYISPRIVKDTEIALQTIIKGTETVLEGGPGVIQQDLCIIREYKMRNFDTIMRGIQDHIKLIELYEKMGMPYQAEKCRAKLGELQKKARNFNVEAPFL